VAARKAAGQDVEIIALKEEVAAAAAEQDMKMAALEAKVAEKMQALAAPSLQLPTLYLTHATHPPHSPHPPHPPRNLSVPSPPLHPPASSAQDLAAPKGWLKEWFG